MQEDVPAAIPLEEFFVLDVRVHDFPPAMKRPLLSVCVECSALRLEEFDRRILDVALRLWQLSFLKLLDRGELLPRHLYRKLFLSLRLQHNGLDLLVFLHGSGG